MFIRQQLFIAMVAVVFWFLAGWMFMASEPYLSTMSLAGVFTAVLMTRLIARQFSRRNQSRTQRYWNVSSNPSVKGE